MLRTNLSTRPFYNERGVHLLLGALALALLLLTAFDINRYLSLARGSSDLTQRADRAEARTRELRTEAARLRAGINPKELELVSAAATEANALIDRRTFSWTELFNQFEKTLPPDVRIQAVRPKTEKDGSMSIVVVVLARGVDDVNKFMESLSALGAFPDLLSREEHVTEDGFLQATLEGRYRRVAPADAAAEAGQR